MMNELELSEGELTKQHKTIVKFIRTKLAESKAKGVVIALSGGIDSSVVAKLASEAVKEVHGLILPEEGVNDPRDKKDAIDLAEKLGINYKTLEINDVVNAVSSNYPWGECKSSCRKMALANVKPRVRMIYNYLTANLENLLVLGTTNKTELLIGYFTKYGDGACDLEPIACLYKTQLRQLARHIGVPDGIIDKTPSAGLWPGQTDEDEIGLSYEEMDSILYCLNDLKLSIEDTVEKTSLDKSKVEKISNLVSNTVHKRSTPCMP